MRCLVVRLMFAALVVGNGDDAARLVAQLRDPKLSIEQREAIEGRLFALGDEGALALRRWTEEVAAERTKRLDGARKHYLDDFARAAEKLIGARLDRKAQAQLDQLRKQVLALNADADLTKEKIHDVGDPALQRLGELLVVTPEQLVEADAKLAKAREALLDGCFELDDTLKLWKRCNDALPEIKRAKPLNASAADDERVKAQERWLAGLATPMGDRDRKVLLDNRTHDGELDPEEAAGVLDLNLLRIRLGLNALVLDVKLCKAARGHSNDMRTLGFFAHESPVEGKHTPWDRAAREGTSAHAENIERGSQTGAGANEGWWYSPGHHKNMTGGHSTVGLGRSEDFWTQMFG